MGILQKANPKQLSIWTALTLCGFAFSIVAVLYLNAHPNKVFLLQSYGPVGIVASVVAMTILCMTPVPSESLLFILLKVYGITWGIIFGWSGLILSNIIVFYVIRKIGRKWMPTKMYPKWFEMIDGVVSRTGRRGLLLSRLLPIPAFFTSLIIAIMPSVSFLDYLWTSAVSVMPYYTGIVLIFKGLTSNVLVWLPLGLAFLLVISLISSRALKHRVKHRDSRTD